MDYHLLLDLNRFSVHHDAIEDPLNAYVGVSEILFVVILVLLFFAVRGRWRQLARRCAIAGGLSAGLALLIGHFISQAVARPRPFVAHPHTVHAFLAHAPDYSFPSDHSTAAFAIAMAIFLRQRAWGAVVLVLAFLIALGRVMLGLHYPSDVVGGAVLGILTAVVLWLPVFRRVLDRLADAVSAVLEGFERRVGAAVTSRS